MTPLRRCGCLSGLLLASSFAQDLSSPSRVLLLQGETFHVQGIDIGGDRLWVSAVDQNARKGRLFEYSLSSGRRLRSVEVQDGVRYHPGGIATDAVSIWIPVAEYRRDSSAVIERRSKATLELMTRFSVEDHIGCVAVQGDVIVGGNWDSRTMYVWNARGELQRKLPNPRPTAYQDMKLVGGHLVASGLLPGKSGVVDWLEFPDLTLIRSLSVGATDRGQPYTREGMTYAGGKLYFLPEDRSSRLFVFDVK